mgnify:CR=1 FL=1
MGTYIHFTDEQKERANSVDLEEFLRQRGEKLLRAGRESRLARVHHITVRGNEWYDHASKEGGGPISFVQNYFGLSYPEAVTRLLDGEQAGSMNRSPKKKEPKKKFIQPPVGPGDAAGVRLPVEKAPDRPGGAEYLCPDRTGL